MQPDKTYDITIIGGGPTGLFGLFYACLRDMEAVLIDSLPELGGQLMALYPDKNVYDVPGFPCIRAEELAQRFIEQATMHRKQDIWLCERVEEFERESSSGLYRLATHSGKNIRTRTMLITAGPGAFQPNKLPLPNLDQLEGRSLHYFVRDAELFRDKRLVIVGGGDSAFDWILHLYPIARQIALVHRRDVFRAAEDSVAKVQALPGVDIRLFQQIKDVELAETGQLKAVVLEDVQTQKLARIEADMILANLGFAASLGPVKEWGIRLSGNHIDVNQKMETNLPGVYAAGDVASYPGKIKLIATGTAEAAVAVNVAKHYIDPAQREQPMHSTSLFDKKKVA